MFRQAMGGEARIRENWVHGRFVSERFRVGGEGVYCFQAADDVIISGSRDNMLKVWQHRGAEAGYELQSEVAGHVGSVLCLQFDEDKIVSGSSDATIRTWCRKTGKQLVMRGPLPGADGPGHHQSVLHLRFQHGLLVTCSKDQCVMVWRIDKAGKTLELDNTLEHHRAAVNVVEFDMRYIVSASGDRTAVVWDTSSGRLVRTLEGHGRGIACLQYEDRYVVTGSSDSTICLWDVHTGAQLHRLVGHADLVRCVRMDVAARRIVSGSYDKTIRVWDMDTGSLLLKLTGHDNKVFRVQLERSRIISSSQDDTIRIWDLFDMVPGHRDPETLQLHGPPAGQGWTVKVPLSLHDAPGVVATPPTSRFQP